MSVNGSIGCKELTVTDTGWADFVFDDGYNLPTLQYVEDFIKTNKHLPDVPSSEEVKKNGVSVGDSQRILLQKIEELTLYLIDIKKENEQLKERLTLIEKNGFSDIE